MSWLFLDLAFPSALLLWIHWILSLRITTGILVVSLLSKVFPIELWDSLSNYVNPGIACLASQSSDWLGALWASLSGVQSSMTFVRLNVIGHH